MRDINSFIKAKMVKIIDKYILKEFLRIFFLTLLALTSIYLLVTFFERIDDLVEYHAPLSAILRFFLFKIPLIIYEVVPYSVLISTILTLGILSGHMEIIAMRASGIGYLSIVKSILLSSLFISILTFSINETIAPETNRRVRKLTDRWIEGNLQDPVFQQHKVWLKGREGFFKISLIDPGEGVLKGFTLFQLNEDFSIYSRIDAGTASWEQTHWNLKDVVVTDFLDDDSIDISNYSEKRIDLSRGFEEFQRLERNTDEMGFMELWGYINRINMDGYKGVRYTVDLHSKVSFPFGSLIMAIIGISFAMIRTEKGGMASGIGLGIIVSFIFWVITAVTRPLGYGDILPPFLAAWAPNLTFGILGVLMYTYVE